MNVNEANLTVNSKQNSNLFSNWNETSWIRSKPMRDDSIIGLPFSPDLVPLASHFAIAQDHELWIKVLAYRLLAPSPVYHPFRTQSC